MGDTEIPSWRSKGLHRFRTRWLLTKIEGFLPDFHIRTSQNAEYVHHQILQYSFIGWNLPKGDEPIQNDKFDVIVALFYDQINVARCSRLKIGWLTQ